MASLPRSALPQTRGARIALQTKRPTLVNMYVYVYTYVYAFDARLGLFVR